MTPSNPNPLPNQRLTDLIRYCRHELFAAGLITDEEYADLVKVGADAARRLETYDDIKSRLQSRDQALTILKATLDDVAELVGLDRNVPSDKKCGDVLVNRVRSLKTLYDASQNERRS